MSVNHNLTSQKTTYPLSLSLSLIIGAIILSFVDLMFLNDVIGRILNIGSNESMFIAFTLGMVGIGVMAHQGARVAHGETNLWQSFGHYALWILLGVAFMVIRFFSASIIGPGDDALMSIFGASVREVDVVVAPLMFLLYLATGVMVADGSKQLHESPDYAKWKADRKEARFNRMTRDDKRRAKAEQDMIKAREAAEKALGIRRTEIEDERQQGKTDKKNKAVQDKLNRNYDKALAQYNAKLNQMKANYQKISSNIDYVKDIDAQEAQFENKVKPSLMKIVKSAVENTQNAVALAIRTKTGEDLAGLRTEIATYNAARKRDV